MPDEAVQYVDELIVDPKEDFKDIHAPAGWYEADISSCRAILVPNDAKYNAGLTQIQVRYRLRNVADNPDLNGYTVSGFGPNLSMIWNRGQSFGWQKWLEAMGMPVNPETEKYSVKPQSFEGLPVRLNLGTKQIQSKNGPRIVNTVESVQRPDAVPTS